MAYVVPATTLTGVEKITSNQVPLLGRLAYKISVYAKSGPVGTPPDVALMLNIALVNVPILPP
jgi:hypothetical protein